MARINFEDDVEAQDEFWVLLPLLGGDRDRAIGKLVRFFRIAQKAYGHDEPMTEEDLRSKGFGDMIESGWAKPVEGGGYQALGAKKHFNWYRQRCEAGQERADTQRDEKGRFQSKRSSDETPTNTGDRPATVQPLTLSLTPSLTLSQKKKKNIRAETEIEAAPETHAVATAPASLPTEVPKKPKFSELTRAKMQSFIKTYAEGYKGKYNSSPDSLRDKALMGKLGHWIEGMGIDRANQLVQVYLQVDYKPINDSFHDLWLFFRHLNRIANALDTGKADQTNINWAEVFR